MIKINDGSKDKIYSSNIELIDNFTDYSSKNLDFDKPVEIDFLDNEDNAKNPLGTTAHYNPDEMKITIYVTGRHLKDILRSISHELIHHVQNCRGDFNGMEDTGLGYAQKDKHMRNMEQEAYTSGNIMNFRDFEDTYKKENRRMKTPLKELKKIINEEAQAVIAEISLIGVSKDFKKAALGSPEGAGRYLASQNSSTYVNEDEGLLVQKSVQKWLRASQTDPNIAKRFIDAFKAGGGGRLRFKASFSAFSDVSSPFINKQLASMRQIAAAGVQAGTKQQASKAQIKPSTTASPTPRRTKRKCLKLPLGRGCTGELVKKIQKLLILVGYRRQLGKTDGDYGGRTVRAVKEFQKDDTSLKVDGVVGKLTFQALKELAKDIKANSGPVHKKAKPASASPKAKPASASPIPKRFTAQQIGTVLKNMNKVVSPEDPKAKAIIKKLMRAQDKGELLDLKKIKLVADTMLLPDDAKPISN
jgi:peptidoglycan hydrolase-like protein with peptidoglycan-binding domain